MKSFSLQVAAMCHHSRPGQAQAGSLAPPPMDFHGLPCTSMHFHGLPSVEHRWNIYRSKFHRAKCIKQHLSDKHPMKIHRTSNENPSIEHLSKLQRTSIQNLSNITREPNEPPIMQRKSKNRNASSSPPHWPIGTGSICHTRSVCSQNMRLWRYTFGIHYPRLVVS